MDPSENKVYRAGDIALVSGHSLLGQIIRYGTKSPYSHVKIIIDSDGRTIEAIWPRVCFGRVAPTDTIMPTTISPDTRLAVVTRAKRYIGKRYSIISLLSDALVWLGLPLVIEIPKEYNCAQLVCRCFLLDLDQNTVSPGDIFRYFARRLDPKVFQDFYYK